MVITKYYIANCFHCKHIEQTFTDLKKQFECEQIKFREVFVAGESDLTRKLKLHIFPAVIITDNEGNTLERVEGVILPKELKKMVEGAVRSVND